MRIGNISDDELKKDILSGKRSKCDGEMTDIEMTELVQLIKKNGGRAILKGTILKTNKHGHDLYEKYIAEYVLRKLRLAMEESIMKKFKFI